ncbi:MAG TPA: hypothetical protein VEK07_19415 [Polyangiaceae bacterium]|nr:hypothetical protein [Polyangiaceae bacterium]
MLAPAPLPLLRGIVAVLVMLLGAGNGLSGLVRAFAPREHVCTCASGGSHASCPVCNPSLGRKTSSRLSTVDGVPCGEPRGAVQVAGDPALAARPPLVAPCPFAPAFAQSAFCRDLDDVPLEPTTPPPRIACT